ncbi:MAG: hypothetical protein ACLSG5_04300 [Oscillospiraceae bacterium]
MDMVFGTHVLHTLPQLIYEALTTHKRQISIPQMDGVIAEGYRFAGRANSRRAFR